jgi:DeoR/GlpR family transcriptional regulator of sugar metabolism
MLPQDPQEEYPLNIKKTIHHAEKTRIGRAAAKLILPKQTVVLDSGTTSVELARAIRSSSFESLTIITHALDIACQFADSPNISVIMLGGIIRHVSRSFVGPQAERMISELHADHLFLGVDGLDPEIGLSTPDLLEAQLNRLMIGIAHEVTVIADASKLGRRSLSVISALSSVRRVITDNRASAEMLRVIRSKGVEVIVV